MVADYSQTVNQSTFLDVNPHQVDQIVEKITSYAVFSALDLKSAYKRSTACGYLFQFRWTPFCETNGVSCFQSVTVRSPQQKHPQPH